VTGRYLRAAVSALVVSTRLRVVNPFTYLNWLVFPLMIALVGFVLLGAGVRSRLVYAALGGGLIGYWSMAYLDGGSALQEERWSGTLELLMGTPVPFAVVAVGKVAGSLLLGLISFVPALIVALAGFHARLHLDPAPFGLSMAVLTLSLFAVAMAFVPLFVLWRAAFPIVNGLEVASYTLCGFMFPVGLLPGWAQAVAALLPPRWAIQALYAAAGQETHPSYWAWWGLAVAGSAAWLAAAALLFRLVSVRARVTGQLALA
jgi:ABC-2 type transport system permease protein